MNRAGFLALLPLIVLAATIVVVMLSIAWRRRHGLTLALTLAGLALGFASLWIAAPLAPCQVTPLLVLDRYSLFFFGLFFTSEFAIALLAYDYLRRHEVPREEFYLLSLLATLGAAVLAASSHFASFFLGLETMSISLYALIAYLRPRPRPLEAGVKYLVLAAASAAFLLFGIALIYAALGTLDFRRIAPALAAPSVPPAYLAAGFVLLLAGIGFKLALVPFHLWTPDVYEGAPAPVAAWIATLSKGSIFALLLRFLYSSRLLAGPAAHRLLLVLSLIAFLSMILGNLLALLQSNVKRILAYSSIAHMGYLLVPVLAGLRPAHRSLAVEAVAFYLVAYFLTTLGAFGVIGVLSTAQSDAGRIEDFQGLFWRRPLLAGIFAVMLFSLAGIPATAGFMGKYYLVAAGASAAAWALIVVLVVTSVIGLFYYLRIVAALFAPLAPAPSPRLSPASGLVLGALLVGLIWLGVFPEPMIRLIHALAIR